MGNPNWQKGKSGNPSGRPKVDPKIKREVEKIFQAASVECARRLVAIAQNAYKDDTALKACIAVLERVFGKIPQGLEHTGEGGSAFTVILKHVDS